MALEEGPSDGKCDRFDQLAEDVRTFLAVRDGRANTDEIVHRFQVGPSAIWQQKIFTGASLRKQCDAGKEKRCGERCGSEIFRIDKKPLNYPYRIAFVWHL